MAAPDAIQAPSFAPAPEREGPLSLFGLLPEELQALGPGRDAGGLFGGLHRPWTWGPNGPVLGRDWRASLQHHRAERLTLVDAVPSVDGSTRCILEASDGHRFEAVWMPRNTRSPRVTLCLSSQVGCAMGCTFCATGAMGIRRNLTAAEIVLQVHTLLERFGPRRGHEINIVFIGMGEPLHNVEHVAKAIALLCHPAGLGLSERRITVSTSGLVPGIDKLATVTPRPLLALSVNATTDAQRAQTMPVTRAYPLAALREALLRWPLRPRERITLEYVLRAGDNDTEDDADRLAAFATGFPHFINLIPLNEHQHSEARRPDEDAVLRFADWLHLRGHRSHIRHSRGQDVGGACGQLVQLAGQAPRRRQASAAGEARS